MSDTKYSRARDSFAWIKHAFAADSIEQFENEIIFDRPGPRQAKVRFQAEQADPKLHLIKEGRPHLAPDFETLEPPEVECELISFDAFFQDGEFGWVKASDLESPRDNQAMEALIREWL